MGGPTRQGRDQVKRVQCTIGYVGDGMVDRLKAVGCKHFISKPFDIVELIELVKTIALEKKLLG